MKAEQRKELETNALADRMGHLMQRMKTQPRRATLYYVVGAIAILVVTVVVWRWFQVNRAENSANWFAFYNGTQPLLIDLARQTEGGNPSKAARFQFAWYMAYDLGLKRLGVANGTDALDRMDEAASLYRALAKECADDPIWESQAMYALAVIEENHTVQKADRLDAAKGLYEDLVKKYPESACGKLAKEWLDNFEKPDYRKGLIDFYMDMHSSLNIRDPALEKQLLEQIEKHRKQQESKKSK
jgi:hypothetical protein